jgi:XTP/dITP diphosphohydrolase
MFFSGNVNCFQTVKLESKGSFFKQSAQSFSQRTQSFYAMPLRTLRIFSLRALRENLIFGSKLPMKLLFASSNQHKITEIKLLLPAGIELLSLADIDFHDEIPETAETIEGNAILKAEYLTNKLNIPCFADDTGLVIPSLNGEPGVYSARYAGEQRNADDNMNLVLSKLESQTDRSAYFLTVIALQLNGKTHLFEGRVEGRIISEKRGSNGFGYDPIFEPENQGRTFAEMNSDEKNSLSHRARALEKMIAFLNDER